MGGGLTVVVNAGDASGSGGRRRAAPVICDGKEEADAMQKWMVNSGVWSVTTNASCSDGEWRLEAVMASGDDELLVPLQNKMIPMD
jgi:hypothetical protein